MRSISSIACFGLDLLKTFLIRLVESSMTFFLFRLVLFAEWPMLHALLSGYYELRRLLTMDSFYFTIVAQRDVFDLCWINSAYDFSTGLLLLI